MHNVTPSFTEPMDGASVLVVEGVGAGLGGCSSSDSLKLQDNINLIEFVTDSNIQQGRPTITEISPQRPCDSTLQDWKNLIFEIVNNVENSAGDHGTWWGGIMLDEEDGAKFGFSAADLEDLNGAVQTLMASTTGISGLYTEAFTSGTWDQPTFRSIIGGSHAAPLIASALMVSRTNDYVGVTHMPVLVTWGLGNDFNYHSLYRQQLSGGGLACSDGPACLVIGSPFNQWGLNLSNCFIGPNPQMETSICNDIDGDGVVDASDNCPTVFNQDQANFDGDSMGDACDPDEDNDGCGNVQETQLHPATNPLNQWDFYSVPVPALFVAPNPATDVRDGIVSAADGQAIFGYFKAGAVAGTTLYNQDLNRNGIADGIEYDRTVLGPGESGPPDGVVSASEAQVAFAQFKDGYAC